LLVFTTDAVLPQPAAGDDYTFEFLDGSDQLLEGVDFELSFRMESLAGMNSRVTVEDQVAFGFCLDLPEGAQTLRLRQGVTTLAEVEKSANPPSVAFTGVTEQAGNVLDAAWMGADLDGDDLTYTLLYSPNGVSLQPLAVDLETTTFSFDLDTVTPRTIGAFLRVRASDGFNVAEDEVGIEPVFAILDVDANGAVQPLTDGLLVLRHQFGFSGGALVNGAIGAGCGRCTAVDIASYQASIGAQLDVDGNGSVEPLTDGLLVLRFLFGFSGTTLTNGAVGGGCTRCDSGAIAAYLQGLL
jgi:hypothetical protein